MQAKYIWAMTCILVSLGATCKASESPYVHIVTHDSLDPNLPWCTDLAQYLRKYGYELVVSREYPQDSRYLRLVIVSNPYENDMLMRYPFHKRGAILWEPPSVQPHCYNSEYLAQIALVFTWDDDLVASNQKFQKYHYWVEDRHPKLYKQIPWTERKLMVLMNANKSSVHPHELYGKRREFVEFCAHHCPEDFDVYGSGWPSYPMYRGFIADKGSTLCRYKFNIAYENITHIRGYVSEKIIDALWAGCVPVYWGADNITDYVPAECFVDRRQFASDEQLYEFLKHISEDQYEQYICAIERFLASSGIKKFTMEGQVEPFGKAILRYLT